MRLKWTCTALLSMALLWATPLVAQDFRGRINGTVTDNTGAVLPGVTVTATSPALIQPQVQVTGATTKASGAEVNTGTDDAKFVTAKAIADSNIISVAAQTHIDDPTGGSTEDEEARAAIADILDALEAAGIVAPAA